MMGFWTHAAADTFVAEADAILLLRTAYLAAAALVLIVFFCPPLSARFLQYGPRSSTNTRTELDEKEQGKKGAPGIIVMALDYVATWTVPHSWFASFYATSVLASLYWAPEILIRGPALRAIAEATRPQLSSMTFNQVKVAWLMMLVQGSRRLYECMALSKSSQSQMWIGHWMIGVLFYLGTSVAVWVEGIAAIQEHKYSVEDLLLNGPSFRTFLALLLFMLASGLQHDCHAYLASLKTSSKGETRAKRSDYRFPEHPAFNISLTPHYFAECLIYLALAIVTAPASEWLNWTMMSALVFVVVNLGTTAYDTKQWYETKFGAAKVKDKARMLPYIY